MRFIDFVTFDTAAQSVFDNPICQQRCRAILMRLLEAARRYPGRFMAEATARKDVRRGVAFRQKSLDDLETGVFAQRLAARLPQTSTKGGYGDFLHQSVLQQGQVSGRLELGSLGNHQEGTGTWRRGHGRLGRSKHDSGRTSRHDRQGQLEQHHCATAEGSLGTIIPSAGRLEKAVRDRPG